MPMEKFLLKNMKSERKHLSIIRTTWFLFFLIGFCLFFNSCITINQMPDHSKMNPFTDPVCGMKVDTSTSLKTEYNGVIYYFDSQECQKVFLKSPEKFAVGGSSHHNNKISHNMGWIGGTAMVAVMVLAMTTMIIFGYR